VRDENVNSYLYIFNTMNILQPSSIGLICVTIVYCNGRVYTHDTGEEVFLCVNCRIA
jgi:hypothetical protein